MRKILVVVDMQNDFITGSLGTKEARNIVDNVVDKIMSYNPKDVFFTKDVHYDDYLSTQEGKMLPIKHCINGTEGANFHKDIYDLVCYDNYGIVFNKSTFASYDLGKYLESVSKYRHMGESIVEIELIGLCTDICVISNALMLKSLLPEIKITVDSKCCSGTTSENHLKALDVMKSCQINVI